MNEFKTGDMLFSSIKSAYAVALVGKNAILIKEKEEGLVDNTNSDNSRRFSRTLVVEHSEIPGDSVYIDPLQSEIPMDISQLLTIISMTATLMKE